LTFVREHRDKPFFLYLPVTIPHLAIQAPPEEVDAYRGKIPESPAKEPHGHYHEHPTPHAGYAAMVSYMDKGVGQVVDLVHELGLDDNTLIIFTSDNGPTYERLGGADSDFFDSALSRRGRKGTVYEGGLRIPLIVRWPGKIKPASQSNAVAAMWDLLPTICDAAKVATPQNVDGVSLLGELEGTAPSPKHEYLYWEFPNPVGQQAVRWGDWKGVRTELAKGPQRWQLFNLAADEFEAHDVADEHPEVVKQIEQIAAQAHVPSQTFPLQSVDSP
jgi:arylsulfatase